MKLKKEACSRFPFVQVHNEVTNKFKSIPARRFIKKRAKEILINLIFPKFSLQEADEPSYYISVETPSGTKYYYADNDYVLDYCVELCRIPHHEIENNEPEPFHLNISSCKGSKIPHILLNFPVVGKDGKYLHDIRNLEIPIPLSNQMISERIAKMYDTPVDSVKLYDYVGNPAKEYSFPELVERILHDRFYLVIDLGDKTRNMIKTRELVLKELYDTEESYLSKLEGFKANVISVLERLKILPVDKITQLSASVTPILILHTQIFKDYFKKLDLSYADCIGPIFCTIVQCFKCYTGYVSTFNEINDIIIEALRNKKHKAILDQFTHTPYAENLQITGVIIMPIQRGPRYPLLLREILHNTPPGHPDYESLTKAYALTKETLFELQDKVDKYQKDLKMIELESKLVQTDTNLIQHARYLRCSFLLQTRDAKVLLFIFSDEVWIVDPLTNGKLSLKQRYRYDDIFIASYGDQGITILSNNITKKYILENRQQQQVLLQEFRKASINYQVTIENDIEMTLTEVNYDRSEPVSLYGHSMISFKEKLYIFGGYGTNGKVNNDFFMVKNSANYKFVKYKKSIIPPRAFSAMVMIKFVFYVYGGIDDNKNMLNDLWKLDIRLNEGWIKLEPTGNNPPAGYGFTYTLLHDKFILIGGNDSFGVYEYDPEQNTWTEREIDKNSAPSSLFHHQTMIYKENVLLLMGGKFQDGTTNDSLIMLFLNNKKISYPLSIGLFPVSRIGHGSFLINGNIICIGGNESEEEIFVMPLSTKQWLTIPTSPKLGGMMFAALASDGKRIHIHGGLINNIISHKLYEIAFKEMTDKDLQMFEFSCDEFQENKFIANMIKNPQSVKNENWIPDESARQFVIQ